MSKKINQYSAEEKSKIAIEAIKEDLTIAQISSKFSVHASQIYNWKKQGIASMITGFRSKPKSNISDQEDLIKQLYEQIGQLTVERDWLKKKYKLFGFKG